MSQENEKEISFSNSSLLILSKIIIQCFIKLSIICENFQNFKIYKTIRIIILLINGIVLGYYSELDLWNPFFYFIENIFLFFYFIDFLIKQISFGLYKHNLAIISNKMLILFIIIYIAKIMIKEKK